MKALGWTTVGSGARSLCKCWKYRDTLGDLEGLAPYRRLQPAGINGSTNLGTCCEVSIGGSGVSREI